MLHRITTICSRLILWLGMPGAAVLLSFAMATSVAGASPYQLAGASSSNANSQSANQRQNTLTVAAPVTLLSGNAVALGSAGNTTSQSNSGVVVAPQQSSSQSNWQSSSASASNNANGDSASCDWGSARQVAYARSGNASWQRVYQRQNTVTVAVPVTLLSGNAVALGSAGNTTSHSNSGVNVHPSQSSAQSNWQRSMASASNRNSGNCGDEDCGCRHGSKQYAKASSHNSSSQRSSQRQNTVTVAAPVTALSGNAVSVGSAGNTTSHSNSGVVVAPQQSSKQVSKQQSSASASNTGTSTASSGKESSNCEREGSGQQYTKSSSHKSGKQYAKASSHNTSSQHAKQSQNTVTVAAPVTLLSGNAVSVGSAGNTTSHSNSGVVVAPQQSSSQSSTQQSSASAANVLGSASN